MKPLMRRLPGRLASLRDDAGRHPRHAILAGLVLGLLFGPAWPPGVLLAAVAAVAGLPRRELALGVAVAVVGGAALADARLDATSGAKIKALEGRTVAAAAVVLEPVRARRYGVSAARVKLLDGPGAGEQAAARIPARTGWPPAAGVGDIVALRGEVVPLAFNERYQRRRGAHVALAVGRAAATGRRRGGALGALDAARRRAERVLASGSSAAQGALLRGMVLGQDEDLEEPVRDEFRASGLAHLLAASGQNVMLLAMLAIAAAAALGAGLRARLGVALVLVALYVPLAGAGPSIQRAGVMGAAGLIAGLAGRPASRWYAVGLAAAGTLALNPRAAGDPGWQLSFAAVVAMLAFAPALRGALARRGWPGAAADVTAVTVAATVGTAPLMALHFEAVSLAALPANLLAAPAVAPVMWLGTLACAAGQASAAAGTAIAAVAAYPVAYVEWIAHETAGLPGASVEAKLGGPLTLAAAYGVIGLLALGIRAWAARRADRRAGPGARRRRALVALAAIGAVAAGASLLGDVPAPRHPEELVVSFLDVGQGDATLLQRGSTAMLVDTGPPGGPILERLREAGVERLDVLLLTHAQADHEGMAPAVLRSHPARLVLNGGAGAATPVQRALPALAARAGARTVVPSAGQVLSLGPVEVRLLWPPPRDGTARLPEGDPNDSAVVAHVRLGAFDLLLPADAESEVTAALDLPAVDALKVAHHGSDDAGLPAQLARLRPRFAAIEVGRGNTYGHPTPETLAALNVVPAVARTDRDGTIRLRVRGDRMAVERGSGR